MKIAVFYNLLFGGAKRVVYEQVKGLTQRNHTMDVYRLDGEVDAFDPIQFTHSIYKYTFDSGIFQRFPVLDRFEYDLRTFYNLKKLHQTIASDIDANQYDLVLVHPDRLTQSPYLLRFLKTPSVYYCQEPLRIAYEYALRLTGDAFPVKILYEEAIRYIRKRIDRENVRSASLALASCLHIRERMIESYDVYPKISYPGIDPKMFRRLNAKKNNEVIFVGNKEVVTDGYDLAYEAIQRIPKHIRPKLTIISWKKDNKKRLTDVELVKSYNRSLVTFCLSRLETFGLVPLESMSCGVPVIATNISGHRETVRHGKTGFLVEFNTKEIADILISLIQNPSKLAIIGSSAREYIIKEWTWDKRILELESILKNFVHNRE